MHEMSEHLLRSPIFAAGVQLTNVIKLHRESETISKKSAETIENICATVVARIVVASSILKVEGEY